MPTTPQQNLKRRLKIDFHTFAVVDPNCASRISEIKTNDWSLSTQLDPSERFWMSRDKISMVKYKRAEFGKGRNIDMIPCHEIIITTTEGSVAQNVQQLIYGGILLAYPDVLSYKSPYPVIEYNSIEKAILMGDPFCSFFQYFENGEFGCRIAEAAWGDTKFIYAIEKLKLSWRLDWFTPHSASPRHRQIFDNEHPEFHYHTNAAFAIIAAYSAIEELGLEIRSSAKKPRFTDVDAAEWNPDVKTNAEKRLLDAGIDIREKFYWVHRGEPTKIEEKMTPILGDKSDYAEGSVVRDRDMEIVDAIHYVSWLRNFVAAHRFSNLTQTISPYDVYNAQCLARQLIMSSLGYWKHPDYFE